MKYLSCHTSWLSTFAIETGYFHMSIAKKTKFLYDTRSIQHFEALEQTIRLCRTCVHTAVNIFLLSRYSLTCAVRARTIPQFRRRRSACLLVSFQKQAPEQCRALRAPEHQAELSEPQHRELPAVLR
jgi:hypothetical protein